MAWRVTAAAESGANHPIATAVLKHAQDLLAAERREGEAEEQIAAKEVSL